MAGRSASSRLRAILSIGPRGPPPAVGCFRPLKARERAVRTKAPGASTSERVYGPLRASVKRGEAGVEARPGAIRGRAPRRSQGDRVGARSQGEGRGGRDLRRSAHAACRAMPDSSRISVGVLLSKKFGGFEGSTAQIVPDSRTELAIQSARSPGFGVVSGIPAPGLVFEQFGGLRVGRGPASAARRSTLGATRPSAPSARSRAVPRRGGLRGYSLGVSGSRAAGALLGRRSRCYSS